MNVTPSLQRWSVMRLITILILTFTLTVCITGCGTSGGSEGGSAGGNTGFTDAGSMTAARIGHSATLLSNGKILVVGGSNGNLLNSTELYDPSIGAWTDAGSMTTARSAHTATLLADGKVLVVGGSGINDTTPANAELYNPSSNTWSSGGSLTYGRCRHTATLLKNGTVLVTGGTSPSSNLASAELYDPSTNSWTSVENMTAPRVSHTATLLPDGKVLVAGGGYSDQYYSYYLASAELFDPATNSWTGTGNMTTGRYYHAATPLADGKVMVLGGCYYININHTLITLTDTEIYDPSTGTWSIARDMTIPRRNNTVTLLLNGKVLVAGGNDYSGTSTASAELYDPSTNIWSTAGSMKIARSGATSTLLADGSVLVMGGTMSILMERWVP